MRPGESFVAQPIRSLQTMLQVIAEDDKTYPKVIPDGIYGPSTANAVSMIQRKSGFPQTGITDQQTWEQIVLLYDAALVRIGKAEPIEILLEPNEVMVSGDSDPYIYLLQSMLIFLSDIHSTIRSPEHSGVLDSKTVQSVKDLQGLLNLPVTGNVDRMTWKQLSKQFTLNAHHYRSNLIQE